MKNALTAQNTHIFNAPLAIPTIFELCVLCHLFEHMPQSRWHANGSERPALEMAPYVYLYLANGNKYDKKLCCFRNVWFVLPRGYIQYRTALKSVFVFCDCFCIIKNVGCLSVNKNSIQNKCDKRFELQ